MGDTTLLWLLDGLLGLVVLGLGWWVNTMWNETKANHRYLDELQSKIASVELRMVGSYVTREEMRESVREIADTVNRRFDRIDSQLGDIYEELKHKVDKP